MSDISNKESKASEKKSLFEYFAEIIGWLQIVASPLLAASILGAIVYFSNPNTPRLIIAIVIVLVGLTIGIIWATRVWRKKGTIHFMSRIIANPELDNNDEEQN
jgi:hypothetical protein